MPEVTSVKDCSEFRLMSATLFCVTSLLTEIACSVWSRSVWCVETSVFRWSVTCCSEVRFRLDWRFCVSARFELKIWTLDIWVLEFLGLGAWEPPPASGSARSWVSVP